MATAYDFSGWVTKNDLKCSDGRTIRRDAFKHNDGQVVPLVWNHQHNDPFNVLGNVLLENRKEGVYGYASFNDTEQGINAKKFVQHGDIVGLSIYANRLKQNGGDVIHGMIREVSLVLAGANPGASIDYVVEHNDADGDSAIIYPDEPIYLYHADDDTDDEEGEEVAKKSISDIFDDMSDEQKEATAYLISEALKEAGVDLDNEDEDDEDEDDEDVEHSDYDYEEDDYMKYNVFDNDSRGDYLSHADMEQIFSDAKRLGSLKDSVEQHMENGVLAHIDGDHSGEEGYVSPTYGIENIDYLFPEARNLNSTPEYVKREDSWVQVFMNGVHHTPFSRIKSTFADITEDDARAKGYMKGNLKKEEVFMLLKRVTTPTTIYKKQKLDRDDVIDIVDFDVVAWIKSEMRMMLNEEIARAGLVGDGRAPSSDDKINELNIRPIWTDEDFFTIKAPIAVTQNSTDDDKAKAFIKAAIKARVNYKGSGNPVLFTTEDMLNNMLLLEDGMQRDRYRNVDELATKMRVSRIVTVPVMENLTRTVGTGNNAVTHTLAGIIVNLQDYNIGADKGGAISLFDDFDIDYNQQKYLIETRCSGALTKPYSAIALEFVPAT